MKRIISSLFLALLLLQDPAAAAWPTGHSGFGIGFILGAPTGLSAKGWLTAQQALAAAAAWKTSGKEESLYLHGDFLIQRQDGPAFDRHRLDWHYGLGLSIQFDDQTDLGVRLPVGLDYRLTSVPLEFFAEIVPVVLLTPDTGVDVDGGIGVRLFF